MGAKEKRFLHVHNEIRLIVPLFLNVHNGTAADTLKLGCHASYERQLNSDETNGQTFIYPFVKGTDECFFKGYTQFFVPAPLNFLCRRLHDVERIG